MPAPAADAGRLVVSAEFARPRVLQQITGTELLGGETRAFSQGRWRGPSSMRIAQRVPVPLQVSRELPSLWRLETGPDVDLSSVDVRYQVLSGASRDSCLAHEQDGDSALCVKVLPLAPRIVSRDERRTLIDGGVRLELDLRHVTRAGRYSGALSYSISVF
jgi:hypothetical protein